MPPEKLFHEMLGLGMNWEVKECEFDRKEGVVRLVVAETKHLWENERSPEAGGKVKCYDHTEELVWRHLNVFEHKCEVRCRLPRGECSESGKVYRVRPPWEGLSKHFTQSFEAMVLLLMREMSVSAAGRMVKETDTRLWRILQAHVDVAHKQADWSDVMGVGCDELSARKDAMFITMSWPSAEKSCFRRIIFMQFWRLRKAFPRRSGRERVYLGMRVLFPNFGRSAASYRFPTAS